MTKLSFASLAGIALLPLAAAAQDLGPCGNAATTTGIVMCLSNLARNDDRRLNAAYTALQAVIEPHQKEPLRASQRLWISYRDANCAFYAAGDGTISRIKAAACLHSMTDARAAELEAAAQP